MKRSEQLKIVRSEKITRMDEILAAANDGEKTRKLTKEENTEFNNLKKGVEDLDAEITDAEFVESRQSSTPADGTQHQRGSAAPQFKKKAAPYSVGKAIREWAKGGDAALTGREKEMHVELGRTISDSNGLLVPYMERAANDTTTHADSIDTMIDPNLSILGKEPMWQRMGLTVLPGLQGTVKLGKKTPDEAGKYAESADITAESNIPGYVTLAPERFGITDLFTKELLAQENPAVQAAIVRDMIKGVDRKLTSEAYAVALAAATEVAAGALTETGLNALMAAVDTDGAFAMDRESFFTGKAVKFDTGSGVRLMSAGNENGFGTTWDGVPVFYSTLFADGAAQQYVVYGDWSEIYAGLWGALEILMNPYTYQKKGQIELTVNRLADMACRNSGAFRKSADLDAST